MQQVDDNTTDDNTDNFVEANDTTPAPLKSRSQSLWFILT